jgi:hypothetical protein
MQWPAPAYGALSRNQYRISPDALEQWRCLLGLFKKIRRENRPKINSRPSVRRRVHEAAWPVGLTCSWEIGYIAEVTGGNSKIVGLSRAIARKSGCFAPLPLASRHAGSGVSSGTDGPAHNNAATLIVIVGVSRMARPQRGTNRFTEEPAPAVSLDTEPSETLHVGPPPIPFAHPEEPRPLLRAG